MSVAAKICGLNDQPSVAAAVAGGARFVGFVFYEPSPRCVTPAQAAILANAVPTAVTKVGLFVDADDKEIAAALEAAKLDMLQFHGDESSARVREAKKIHGRPVMKAIKIASREDVAKAEHYFDAADWLLFDAKPPVDFDKALPGGNGLAFDWQLLGARDWPLPWMLSGGLNAANLRDAVTATRAKAVDVSSGVETRPGVKDKAKIAEFLGMVRALTN
jgi:phosphoribosylanthranilate isomerase